MTTDNDIAHMRAALALASRGLGRVWPNPAVGCVIVDPRGHVVGRGHTQPGGRPHAETEALAMAGEQARGATVYVTLEPCAHHGRTPPCADALIAAAVGRVVIATVDPDPRVAGQGIERLKAAGISVSTGVLEAAANVLNAGFFKRLAQGLPVVTVKLATSLDGLSATIAGDSQWITGPKARARGHLLRAQYDAILIGRRTAEADNPALTCRLPGLEDRSPVRLVLDTDLTLSPDLSVFQTARAVPTWVFTALPQDHPRAQILAALGVEVMAGATRSTPGGLDLREVLRSLGGRGITRVLVEGGQAVTAALLADRLVDRLVWHRASLVIGPVEQLKDALRLKRLESLDLGDDIVETYTIDP